MPDAQARRWIGAQELLDDSLLLARRVIESGYAPTLLAGLWRGGAPIAIAMHEALRHCGLEVDHVPLCTSLYTAIDQRDAEVHIEGLELLARRMTAHSRLLLIDDVFDTGTTMQHVMRSIAQLPGERRIATVWWKPQRNLSHLEPDFHVHQSAQWLVFPHELEGLETQEIERHKSAFCAETLAAMRATVIALRKDA